MADIRKEKQKRIDAINAEMKRKQDLFLKAFKKEMDKQKKAKK